MNKILIGAVAVSIISALVAFDKIVTLNVKVGSLEVQLVAEKGKAERYKELYETEHKLLMENAQIDQAVKKRIQDALNIIIRAYDGTINPN